MCATCRGVSWLAMSLFSLVPARPTHFLSPTHSLPRSRTPHSLPPKIRTHARTQPLHLANPRRSDSAVYGALTTDDDLRALIDAMPSDQTTIVMFSSTWCHHCRDLLPYYLAAAVAAPDLQCYVANVDHMLETTRDIYSTPTFAVYRGQQRIDLFLGNRAQKVADRIWLHSDSSGQLP